MKIRILASECAGVIATRSEIPEGPDAEGESYG